LEGMTKWERVKEGKRKAKWKTGGKIKNKK
jgi:hypothetical protein